VRVLTFQTEDVIHNVLEDGIHKCETRFSRERRDYSADIEQLEGAMPIWCYAPVGKEKFETEDFRNGELFQLFKSEMSTKALSQFAMLELEVEDSLLRTGLTHNAYEGAKVFPYITRDMLKAVYRLSFDEHWYLPQVLLAKAYDDDYLFPDRFRCEKKKRVEDMNVF
jgi:hypothetical protein